ncbi:MAG: hypothetical protein EOP53_05405 [Sphingobacteriales bacterium]|nr:MAG: hypothetical protein EOP53_05405 [Sphingobacteriales bacterium]
MLVVKISLDIYGDKFLPKKALSNINQPFLLEDIIESTDINDTDPSGFYGFGHVSILHPKTIELSYDEDYENWFVEFLENYYQNFIDFGADDFRLFWNIYYSHQCNFEIFDKELLSRLEKFKVSIPISVYNDSSESIRDFIIKSGYSAEEAEAFYEQHG